MVTLCGAGVLSKKVCFGREESGKEERRVTAGASNAICFSFASFVFSFLLFEQEENTRSRKQKEVKAPKIFVNVFFNKQDIFKLLR